MKRMTHRETPANHAYVDRGLVNLSWYSMTDEGFCGPAIDRLAAYEDTGLEPKEVSRLEYKLSGVMHFVDKWLEGEELHKDEVNRAEAMREKTLKLVEDLQTELDRLHELDQAEKDGRLVVLPPEDYTFTIRGDIMRDVVLANCRKAQQGTEAALEREKGDGENG